MIAQTEKCCKLQLSPAIALQWLLKEGRWACVIIFAIQCVVVVVTGLGYSLVVDEKYHAPLAATFGTGLPSLHVLETYRGVHGPALYVLLGNVAAFANYAPWLQRLAILIMSMGTVLLVRALASRLGARHPALPVLLVGLYPYFFAYSLLIMSDIPALFFFSLALYVVLGAERLSWRQAVLGGLSLACAVNIRIHYVFACAGLLAATVVSPRRLNWQTVLVALLPIVLMAPLVGLWKGLTPPWGQHFHAASLAPGSLNLNIASLGFYFWPVLIVLARPVSRSSLLVVPLAVLWLYGFNPNTPKGWEFNIALNFLSLPPYFIYCATLWTIGGLVLVRAYNGVRGNLANRQLAAMLPFAIGVVSLPVWISKYIMGAYLLLSLLAFGTEECKPRRVWVAYAWCALLAIASVVIFHRKLTGWARESWDWAQWATQAL